MHYHGIIITDYTSTSNTSIRTQWYAEIGTLSDTTLLSLYDCNGFLIIFVSSVFPRMHYLPLELLVNQFSGQSIYWEICWRCYTDPPSQGRSSVSWFTESITFMATGMSFLASPKPILWPLSLLMTLTLQSPFPHFGCKLKSISLLSHLMKHPSSTLEQFSSHNLTLFVLSLCALLLGKLYPSL